MSTQTIDLATKVTTHPLESWRRESATSVEEAAKAIGTSRVNWYRIIGGCSPRADLATRIAAIAGVSRAQLCAWADGELCS